MDKVSKFLRRLSKKERKQVSDTLKNIKENRIEGLNIKKLTGYENIFRVRKNKIRINFTKEGDLIEILSVSRKNEKTYKNINS